MRTVDFNGNAVVPNKILCVGKNYVAHIEEMNSVIPENMVVFMKPNASIGNTLHAELGETLHYEGEICLLMCDDVVAGVGFGLDLTKRTTQAKLKDAGLPWERSKSFNGAALFSQFVTAPSSLDELVLELWVDGVLRQRGGVDLMMYRPANILDELHSFTTLDDHDIVMTGTPAGVGAIKAGEYYEGRLLDGDRQLVSVSWTAI